MSDVRESGEQQVYEIRVQGNLDPKWSDWFDGFSIAPGNESETRLIGAVADQAALHGVLHKIRDLGLPLLSVRRLDDSQEGAGAAVDIGVEPSRLSRDSRYQVERR